MKILELNKEDFKNAEFHFHYESDKYYKVIYSPTEDGWEIKFKLTSVQEKIVRDWEGHLFADWMETDSDGGCQIFGFEDNNKIIGWLTIGKEGWTNRLRVYEILIQEDCRNRGYGKTLIEKAKEVAREKNCYAVILETQTSNYNAIEFYKSCGFKLFGCDLNCYHNNDIERDEVRTEMVYELNDEI
jgi:hypothetical protein